MTWLFATLVLYVLSLSVNAGAALLGPSAIALGMWIFFRSGGRQIDAVGVWGLACILFTGAGSLLMPEGRIANPDTTATALFVAIFVTLAVAWIAWIPAKERNDVDRPLKLFDLHWTTLLLLGVSGFFLGQLMSSVGALWNIGQGFLMASPLLATLGAASAGPHRRLALIVPAALVTWYLVTWQGGGRLIVLALLIAVLMTYQYRKPPAGRLLKALVPLLLIPGLLIASLVEVNRGAPEKSLLAIGGESSISESLDSVWSPFYVLSALVKNLMDGQLVTHGFDTLFATLTVWIPSELWPSKPEAWGRSLAWEFNRQAAAGSSHSEAGLLPAEMIWSFGLIGLIVGVPIAGLAVRYINSRLQVHTRLLGLPGKGATGVLVWIAFATALLPLWWGGTFNFLARSLMQLLALGVLTGSGYLVELLFGAPRRGPARGAIDPSKPESSPVGR